MTYDEMLQLAETEGIEVVDFNFTGGLKGLYIDHTIAISRQLESDIERKCVLAEELGHYYTGTGQIINLDNLNDRKQENRGRHWGYNQLISLDALIDAVVKERCQNRYEVAEYLGVAEWYLQEALEAYERKFGIYTEYQNYAIYFNPLTIARYKYQ